MRSGVATLVFLGAIAGCGGWPPLDPSPPAPLGGSGGATTSPMGGGSGGSTVPAISVSMAEALCARPAGVRLVVASVDAMKSVLHGAWVLCPGPGLFHQPQAGIVIDASDRYAFLAWSGDNLVAQRGLDNEGTVEYLDTSTLNGRRTIQVNFVSDLAVSIDAAPPVISDHPRIMLINNEGVETYTYAAIAAIP
jgi:hypothetical protein